MAQWSEQVEILAPAEAVWAVLADVQGWRKWTASVELIRRREQGKPFGLGSEAWVKQPRLPGAVWRVTAFEPGRSFVWQSHAPGVRTVAGHHLRAGRAEGVESGRAEGAESTWVTLELRQHGPLAGPAALLLGRLARRYLAMEAAGLKAYCEVIHPTNA
ncbi:SRPBCC family protein [Kitasatospora sp. NBC_01287]|uniref:SRPBCC family protein n=1 Tax=Kitasatospora sp. NBC_01287 TaxID=2903573 RepID=UPI00224D8505|nr:SRPBCC family protein [Kitasatospora sp. NBC_01287]MCX4749420.1 SRPBCC family protein [Kitasatospora sp. NBC_01287]